jgi:hypothetical protein
MTRTWLVASAIFVSFAAGNVYRPSVALAQEADFSKDPELDPKYAPEDLDVHVQSVQKSLVLFRSSLRALHYRVRAVGKVTAVRKSSTGLRPGAEIVFHYQAHEYAFGVYGVPSYLVVSKGQTYQVLLQCDEPDLLHLMGDRYSPCLDPRINFIAVDDQMAPIDEQSRP